MGIALFREGLKVEIDHDRPLLAYAYLAQTGSQDDILSGLVPIVSPIAQANAGKAFDAQELCKKLKELYGIEIHPWVTDELVPNLVSAGVLIPSELNGSVVKHYYAPAERFESISPIEDEVKTLVDQFSAYCSPLIPQEEAIDPALVESVFLNQLVSLDFHAQLLKPGVKPKEEPPAGRILRLNRTRAADAAVPDPVDTAKQDRLKLLCASFILKLKDEGSQLFPVLVRIASGAIAAEYILNLREPNTTSSLKGMKFYLDGPLVMSYLDVSDPLACDYATLLIEGLASKGAILCIFQHHVEEIRANLKAALARSEQGDGHRATYRRLRDRNFRTYVQSLIGNLDSSIRGKKIAIIRTPENAERYFSADEENNLVSALGNYNVYARARDAAAVAAIVRLRQRLTSNRSDFHQAQHVFVTENAQVARRSARFLLQERIYRAEDVPAAVTDRHLAGLMLVLFGAQGSFELAHHRLIANCASALEPSQELLTSVTGFLESLDSVRAEHFRAIMTTQRSAQYMTRFMLEQRMSLDNVDDASRVLEHLEDQWRTALKEESEAEIKKLQEEHKETLRLAEEATAQAAQDTQRVAEELAAHQEKAAEQQRASSAQIDALNAGLLSLQNQQNEALRRDIETSRARVQTLLEKYSSENKSRVKSATVLLLITAVIFADVSAYLALEPDSFAKKSWIIILASLAVLASSGFIGDYIANNSKIKSRRRFFDQFHSDLFVQRFSEHLEVDYESSSVKVRELPDAIVEPNAELLAKRN
ncbi:hypothetical protein [Pseudomonas sp. BN607]|uniref:hypothetical protein n=1 Tax=Pseudomonas sp. BN607 TaxID=2567895 RepID=UPI0024590631|nr:hypothetical protein [Pseudomonas sp. BN607]MDH4552867.1 hypothetical protein [Pseudomonas sp. BN607]